MERLGIYLLGIAIGLFMLGLLWNARARSAAAERENAVEHTDPPGPSEERSPR